MSDALVTRWLRPSQAGTRDIGLDLLWLIGLGLIFIGGGIGLRDPWPADEPRFALIARDMVIDGEWLVPRVGGELYPDKPPLYFWLLALGFSATGSLRLSFLLPSLLSGLGCIVLVYDLGRRLWNREVGLIAGTLLVLTVQFVWQARQAQIDATLCFFTTLGLYGLLRHLLIGPAWRWYALGWAAAGLGVITKGVGFLPLLALVPWAVLCLRWRAAAWRVRDWRWLVGPVAFVLAVSVWLAPMLLATRGDPTLAAYRDEILFVQTAERYFDAWHHREPFWYFVVEVIPVLWLPLIALVPWLWGKWREAWQRRDLRIALLLSWVGLVVLFFSLSAGKRGVYILPAVPAFVLACAAYVPDLARKQWVRTAVFGIGVLIGLVCVGAAGYLFFDDGRRTELASMYGLDLEAPAFVIGASALIVCALARPQRAWLAYAGALACALAVVSFWLNPGLNDVLSGARFARAVARAAAPDKQLALYGFRAEHLLKLQRPVVHFGYARWREADQEAYDAAAWLNAGDDRVLLVDAFARELCFQDATTTALGTANRRSWYLVEGRAAAACAARGRSQAAHTYRPPTMAESRTDDEAHELSAEPRSVRSERVSEHRK